ncbi:MAG: amidohydrolase [Marmoricola sp.]|nr:amidohydrolase [Marmoricola sp.]
MSTLFKDVHTYDAERDGGLSRLTRIRVEGQRITAIGPDLAPTVEDQVIEGAGHHVVLPGLINAHFHSPANHLKGAFPSRPLEEFMVFESPSDPRLRPTPRQVYLRTAIGALEMIRTGTTMVADDAFLMPEPDPETIDAVMQAYADTGIRASVALDQPELAESAKYPFLELLDPADRARFAVPPAADAATLLAAYDYLISTWHGSHGGRLRAAVSISAPQRVSPEYFGALDDLSRLHGIPLYAHFLETRTQRVLGQTVERFGGRSLVRYAADLGLLSDRVNVIHAVWIDDEDIALIAGSGATVAHNPVSNLRLGSGVMPFRALRDAGVPVALGVDEAICDDSVNLWGVLKMAGLVHNINGAPSCTWPQADELLDCLYAGGAAATGLPDLGRVEVGALADLVVLDLHTSAFTPFNDLARQLVYCESGASVVHTMIDGVMVLQDRVVQTCDEPALLAEARAEFAALTPLRRSVEQELAATAAPYETIVRAAAATEVPMNRWVGA